MRMPLNQALIVRCSCNTQTNTLQRCWKCIQSDDYPPEQPKVMHNALVPQPTSMHDAHQQQQLPPQSQTICIHSIQIVSIHSMKVLPSCDQAAASGTKQYARAVRCTKGAANSCAVQECGKVCDQALAHRWIAKATAPDLEHHNMLSASFNHKQPAPATANNMQHNQQKHCAACPELLDRQELNRRPTNKQSDGSH